MRTLTKPGSKLYWVVLTATLILFTAAFLLPLVWVLLGAFKPPAELAQQPPTILPQTWEPDAYVNAWNYMNLGRFFLNTFVVAIGAWAVQMAVIVPAAYALSKLRPIFGNVIMGLMLATLMLPSTAVLVPVYLTLTDLDLLNNPAGIWLPAAANALNVYLLKRFFDQIPEELLEAARIDGANTWTTLTRIVLPISRPILAVVSIFAVVAAWKDFIWPLLVFPDPAKQTLSVALQRFAPDTPINLLLAGLVLASLPMVALFLAFQRHILAGLTAGGVKG
ncbi:carbohydrate ABC transporter permease [Lentzea terrae]|uniref:carbohydrate ABC transporter permease n=1 Tax=Lentzea terrae TaxID=2200761 RepID=UPI000DD30055|nr:carbohydrate ABC transporter permease [Lentzea terrae]